MRFAAEKEVPSPRLLYFSQLPIPSRLSVMSEDPSRVTRCYPMSSLIPIDSWNIY
jgi:hypothetical protein